MDASIFGFILRHTKKDQLLILLLTLISFPFLYASLEVPKLIINNAIGGVDVPDQVLGWPVDQVRYLLLLCALFLGLVLINGAFKYVLNVYRGVVGERMLRRLRYELFCRILRFPMGRFKRLSQGEVIPIITAETEPLGGFIGEAFALPAFQGGVLLTYLFFIFNQDPLLGAAATVLYPFQLYIIPKLQRQVNRLGKQRVLAARQLGERIGDSISGIREVHVNDTSHFERAEISARLGRIFDIRYAIYKKKFFIKFLNNFLAQVTPFFFYSVGGYYVIQGELSLGALVAVLAAYKDLNAPWKELLKYYQTKEDVRIKYEQVVEMFEDDQLLDTQLQDAPQLRLGLDQGGWQGQRLGYEDEFNGAVLEQLSFDLDISQHSLIEGSDSSGREQLGELLVRLLQPSSGQLRFAGAEMEQLPESVVGQHVGYASSTPHLFNGSIRDNLIYPLLQREQRPETLSEQRQHQQLKAEQTGNSTDDPEGQWLDMDALGLADPEGVSQRMMAVANCVELSDDLFQLGLTAKLPDSGCDALRDRVMDARQRVREQLHDPRYQQLVEPLDWHHYNTNLTVRENILFGSGLEMEADSDERVQIRNQLLRDVGLFEELVMIGRQLTELMVDLFSDLDDSSDLFERFSFIKAADLPEYRSLLKQTASGELDFNDQLLCEKFLQLSFQLCPARHRLGLIDSAIQQRILQARFALAEQMQQGQLDAAFEFFNQDRYHSDLSLMDNILFGRLAYGQAVARERITTLVKQVIGELGLEADIQHYGLEFQVGTGGARLSAGQRQKLAVARALMKNPDVLVLNNALAGMESQAELRLLANIQQWQQGKGLLMLCTSVQDRSGFDRCLRLEQGGLEELPQAS